MEREFFEFTDYLKQKDRAAAAAVAPVFSEIDDITCHNQWKVLSAFRSHRVSEQHFIPSTGYGYDDAGRETLDAIVAECMGTEDALIRHSFASGTATITVGLFGVLRPGDRMLVLTGEPYDTLQGVLGHTRTTDGSLTDFGVKIDVLPLKDGAPDIAAAQKALSAGLKKGGYKAAYIQRSRGYTLRKSLDVKSIDSLCRAVKEVSPDTITIVDNCYGEFVEKTEPAADLLMGSLIKNPGGGIAPCGGYLAGRHDIIEKCAGRMTAPGVGREVGATLGHNRELFMGFFNAPHVTGEALKTAVYAAALFEELGFEAMPGPLEPRADIIESILLKNKENLIAFCRGIQSGAPVDSFVTPEPAPMPGYSDEVIMAAGAFTLGSSIELSADAPLRPPFAVFLQGALNFHSGRFGVLKAAEMVFKSNK